jgi:hypothetical protein
MYNSNGFYIMPAATIVLHPPAAVLLQPFWPQPQPQPSRPKKAISKFNDLFNFS